MAEPYVCDTVSTPGVLVGLAIGFGGAFAFIVLGAVTGFGWIALAGIPSVMYGILLGQRRTTYILAAEGLYVLHEKATSWSSFAHPGSETVLYGDIMSGDLRFARGRNPNILMLRTRDGRMLGITDRRGRKQPSGWRRFVVALDKRAPNLRMAGL